MPKWNLSETECFSVIHSILIDILNNSIDNTVPLNNLVHELNTQTEIGQLSDEKKYNLFSKYLKIEHSGILDFIESYNFYGVIKKGNIIYVKLYDKLICESSKRVTKDKDWIMIN